MVGRFPKLVVALVALGLLVTTAAATADSLQAGKAQASSYDVGIIYSRTGLLSAYGAEYIEGLRLGLAYATHGTGKVNGKKVNLIVQDDGGDPTKAVSAAKDMIGKGVKVLAGTASSGVALQLAPLADQNRVLYISGPAASDAVTGINKYTFRSGRQTYQDVVTADAFLNGQQGKKIVVFAQDSAFGQGNYLAVNAVLGGKGHKVDKTLVPLTASDFTPFAQQVKQANPDLLFVAWAGTTAPAMWKALDQQGAFSGTKVVTGLAEKATWSTFGDVAGKIQFLSHYVYTAPKNKVNDFLVRALRKRNQTPDLFTPDGFVSGQMIVRALQKGNYDVDKMISALEGWKFLAPKGNQAIRAQDHAMLQPMFQVRLVKNAKAKGGWAPKVLGTVSAYKTAPPVKPFAG